MHDATHTATSTAQQPVPSKSRMPRHTRHHTYDDIPPPNSPFRLKITHVKTYTTGRTHLTHQTHQTIPNTHPPTTHNPKPQQERPAAGIQPTTGLRPINALPPRGRSITEFAAQQLTARRFSDRCRRRPRPPPDRRRGRKRCAAHAPHHRAGRAGPKPRCGFRT